MLCRSRRLEERKRDLSKTKADADSERQRDRHSPGDSHLAERSSLLPSSGLVGQYWQLGGGTPSECYHQSDFN
ncbi:hypothetical protein E2C01_082685 [Portunus trituberculatus]|uniref:Uncharacterized protein n=1 Tax=Portunus trituberculatus TaxID=210409 RepID=A0A5B7IZS8_PORTR|nr:hypothetical protein [Portunus trituberculatus]